MQHIVLPQLAWYGPRELVLPVPDRWQLETCHMAGFDRSPLPPGLIAAAIKNPQGMPPLREIAKGRKRAVILFDDMTRVTRTAEIVPHIIAELSEAGMADGNIRFIMALGAHGARTRIDFVKKLGEEIVARFPVFNHNPFVNCPYVGTTKTFGTRVCVSAEVMSCDLKIGVGSVVPHPMIGFGGGGKIVLPGVTSIETSKENHAALLQLRKVHGRALSGMGVFETNPMVCDVEEAADLAGLDMLVNALVNLWGESVSIHAGALRPTYQAAVKEAREHYLTRKVRDKDVVIANSYAKSNEAGNGLVIAVSALREGGDIVLIANTPEGQVSHYLLGPFGETAWGELGQPFVPPGKVNRLIVYSEYPDPLARTWLGKSDRVVFLSRWESVLRILEEDHGSKLQVAVYPSADIQYCA